MRAKERQKYTVYDNFTDLPVIVNGTSDECANAMGVAISTFYSYLSPSRKWRGNRWVVIKDGLGLVDDENCEPKTIGQHMRMCRIKKKMKATQLERLTGISTCQIKLYESDKTYAGLMNLISIADALNVSIDELIGRSRK
jgi:DNA-binding Xre family transcriptional regulator